MNTIAKNTALEMGIPVDALPSQSGPKIMLMGEIGSGKSTAVTSLIDMGYKVRMLATAPGYESVRGQYSSEDFAVAYVPGYSYSLANLKNMLEASIQQTAETITKSFPTNKTNTILQAIGHLGNFVDTKSKKEFGPVAKFDLNTVFVIDDLSGLTALHQKAVVGTKQVTSWPEMNIIQQNLESMLNTMLFTTPCAMIVNAHLERESDPNTGTSILTLSTIGKALAPRLIRFFDEILYAYRHDEKTWYFATYFPGVKLKTRYLPSSSKLPSTYHQLFTAWSQETNTPLPTKG